MVGFEYRIELVPDGKYGVYDLETGEWNGIVRQLMDKVGSLNYCCYFHCKCRDCLISFVALFSRLRDV
jgi:ionotropic kainate glutamate receptor 2